MALKKIIDDFSVLAVEECLVQKLPTLFCSGDVIGIDDTKLAILASESEDASMERMSCNEKLRILTGGLKALQDVQDLSSSFEGADFWYCAHEKPRC